MHALKPSNRDTGKRVFCGKVGSRLNLDFLSSVRLRFDLIFLVSRVLLQVVFSIMFSKHPSYFKSIYLSIYHLFASIAIIDDSCKLENGQRSI